jgi:hypothetical protein
MFQNIITRPNVRTSRLQCSPNFLTVTDCRNGHYKPSHRDFKDLTISWGVSRYPFSSPQGAGSGHRWCPLLRLPRGNQGSPGSEAGRGAGRVLPRGSNRRRGAQTGVPGAPLAHPGKAQCATANSRGRLQSLLLAHLAHNFHIVYVRFVCSLWLFCPLPRVLWVCVCKGAYTPWKRAPSAPVGAFVARGGCETRRTGVRQRAAERSSRCATPAAGHLSYAAPKGSPHETDDKAR